MRSIFVAKVFALAAAACGAGSGQVKPDEPVVVGEGGFVANGTTFRIELDENIDPQLVAIGDLVVARVSSPVVTGHGVVFIPKGAKVYTHVIERLGNPPSGYIRLRVDGIEIDGEVQPMSAEVVSAWVPWGGRAYDSYRGLRGSLPRGTRIEIRLTKPFAPVGLGKSG